MPLLVTIAVFAVVFLGGGQSPQSSAQNPERQGGGDGQSPRSGTGGKANAGTSADAGAEANAETNAETKGGLGHPALGSESAPVVMVEYADYQ